MAMIATMEIVSKSGTCMMKIRKSIHQNASFTHRF